MLHRKVPCPVILLWFSSRTLETYTYNQSDWINVCYYSVENCKSSRMFFIFNCINHGISALQVCAEKMDKITSSWAAWRNSQRSKVCWWHYWKSDRRLMPYTTFDNNSLAYWNTNFSHPFKLHIMSSLLKAT